MFPNQQVNLSGVFSSCKQQKFLQKTNTCGSCRRPRQAPKPQETGINLPPNTQLPRSLVSHCWFGTECAAYRCVLLPLGWPKDAMRRPTRVRVFFTGSRRCNKDLQTTESKNKTNGFFCCCCRWHWVSCITAYNCNCC